MHNLASIIVAKNNAKAEHTFPCGCRFVLTFREIDEKNRIITGRDGWLHVQWLHCQVHAEIVEGEK